MCWGAGVFGKLLHCQDGVALVEFAASSFLNKSQSLQGSAGGNRSCSGLQPSPGFFPCQMAGTERTFEPAEIDRAITSFMYGNKLVYDPAWAFLLECSKGDRGLTVLTGKGFYQTCKHIVDDLSDARRDTVISCLSRIVCWQFAGKINWDETTLEEHLRSLSTTMNATEKRKKDAKILEAIRLFVLCEGTILFGGKEVAPSQIAEKLSWVGVALSSEASTYGPAILMLDALEDLPSLPRIMIEHTAKSVAVLQYVISGGSEPEKVAGMRVASRVITSLTEGGEHVPLSPEADNWLTKLREGTIVEEVVDCIKDWKLDTSVETAVRILKDLSSHKRFREDFAGEEVMRVLVNKVLKVELHHTSVSALLRRVLNLRKVANAFTVMKGYSRCLKILAHAGVADAVVRDMVSVLWVWLHRTTSPKAVDASAFNFGLTRCLTVLDGCQLEDARLILALLVAWSAKSTRKALQEPEGPVDLAVLVRFLTAPDKEVVRHACIFVSWALHSDYICWEGLAQGLGGEAIDALLGYFVESLLATNYATTTLITLRHLTGLHASGEAGQAVQNRINYLLAVQASMMLVDNAFSYEVRAGVVVVLKKGHGPLRDNAVVEFLLSKGAVGALLGPLGQGDIADGSFDRSNQVLEVVNHILRAATRKQITEAGPALLKKLLEVNCLRSFLSFNT